MSGIGSTLSIAKTAIFSQQNGLNVTGHNISNVNNPDYSVQNADQKNRKPALYGGFLFGTGVDTYQIEQSVNKLLEERLTAQNSTKESFGAQESYMRILEGFFDENSETSINSVLGEFWSSWHDLANNPSGSSERVTVLESGKKVAERFESAVLDMENLTQDINAEVTTAVGRVNSITEKIAELNGEIQGVEVASRTANDQRDQRNRLVDELGKLIDVDVLEQPDGGKIINAAGGYTVVNGVDNYELTMRDKEVNWEKTEGNVTQISDDISGGKIGGLLEIRDEVIPKYTAELDELAKEMIWAINYQHSMGTGLEYFSEPVSGEYQTDDSRWLSSYEFGNKIDYTNDFTLWTEDKTTADTEYTKTKIDMGLSSADVTDWQGTAPGGVQSIYKLTVMDGATIGDYEVTEFDGDGLAEVFGSTAGVSTALHGAITDQTLTVYGGPGGTEKIEVKDAGGDAKRSAASIAEALNQVEGVTASASENSATFDIGGPPPVGNPYTMPNAEDGDEVRFSLYVDGVLQEQSFVVDSRGGSVTLQEQFEDALISVTEKINDVYGDDDLSADGMTLTSQSGRTLGVEDFEVQDNAGVTLSNFTGFNTGDTFDFDVNGTQVSVDFTGVDTTDQSAMSSKIYEAASSALQDEAFTVKNKPSTNSILIRTTDGSNITLDETTNLGGSTIDITGEANTTAPGVVSPLIFDGVGSVVVNADDVDTDQMTFAGQGTFQQINESSAGAVNKTGVITGTVTAVMEPGMSIYSSVSGVPGGLFSTDQAKVGSSILTFGGEGGFKNFSTAGGENVTFALDGAGITFTTTAAGGNTELDFAVYLETQISDGLNTAGIDEDYEVFRTGTSVSVVKDKSLEEPIEIKNFSDDLGNNAQLRVLTGTGTDTNPPENDLLDAGNSDRVSATSTLYEDEGIIKWERLDKQGLRTGASGLLHVEDEERVTIQEGGVDTLSFNLSKGKLVAGNVLTVNTNKTDNPSTSGRPDPLDFRVTGQANSINDIYEFKVVSGGKVGHLPEEDEEPLTISWKNSVDHGTFTIEGHDPPYTPETPVEVQVDGMNLKFSDGTLLDDDVFTITTNDTGVPESRNESGQPTGERQSDWHWTIDSFADQFNRQAAGVKADATRDNRLAFEASDTYHVMENIQYSESNGFCEENCSISVNDYSSLDFEARDLQFVRSNGKWGFKNDPTGGVMQLLPAGGDDDGFGVDFSGNGLADIEISFAKQVTGDGFVEFDFAKHDAEDLNFAFSDDASTDSGLLAAAGVNTFFKGRDAMTMEANDRLSDTKLVAAASIDSTTGEISKGDNTNALAMADVQFQEKQFRIWSYNRDGDAESSTTTATLDNYYNQMIGSMGTRSRSIKSSNEFADVLLNSLTEQRDAVSAVSLDEEMIKLMKYQHAFSAASKLLTVSDEMLNTLINVR